MSNVDLVAHSRVVHQLKFTRSPSMKVTIANLIECRSDERLSLNLKEKITEVELL